MNLRFAFTQRSSSRWTCTEECLRVRDTMDQGTSFTISIVHAHKNKVLNCTIPCQNFVPFWVLSRNVYYYLLILNVIPDQLSTGSTFQGEACVLMQATNIRVQSPVTRKSQCFTTRVFQVKIIPGVFNEMFALSFHDQL